MSLVNSSRVDGQILGHNKRFLWLRVPYKGAHRVLTLPRATLRRGFATATRVLVDVNYATMRTEGRYYVADVRLVSVIDPGEAKTLDTPAGAGAS